MKITDILIAFSLLFPFGRANAQQVVINEINYNSAASFGCANWVELFNNSRSRRMEQRKF